MTPAVPMGAVEPTLLFQLRETARTETDELIRFNLKLIADELSEAIKAFADDSTQTKLQMVNGKWAQAVRTLDFASRRKPPGSSGAGLKDGALLTGVA